MILEDARRLGEAGDTDGAIQCLNGHPDFTEAMQVYSDLVMKLYWQSKDVGGAVALATSGTERALAQAETAANPDDRQAANLQAKTMLYNIASFCWTGWDEPGIQIGEREQGIGLQAAQRHYELVQCLALGPQIAARAAWMLGAQMLAARDYAAAAARFWESADLALEANNEAESLLAQGFALLAESLEDPADTSFSPEQLRIQDRLRVLKDGDEFVRQIATAEAVFSNA